MKITRTNIGIKMVDDYPIFIVYTDEHNGSMLMFVFREFEEGKDRKDDKYTGVDELANIAKWENEKCLIDDPNVEFLSTGTKLEVEI